MATIRKLSNGKFRAEVRKQQTTLKTKTFITRSKAEDRGNKLDQQIKVTLKLQAKKLKELSPKKVEELGGKELFDKYRSSNTVIRYKAVLSSVFKYAIQQGDLDDNPVEGVYVKATPNKIVRYLSDEERESLLEACKASSWDRLYLLVVLAITTGMRKSELINLRWTDIDFEAGLAKLSDTKNGEPRINPIPEPALIEMKKFRQIGNGYIFNSPTKLERPFEFQKRWFDALNKAGVGGTQSVPWGRPTTG